MLIKVTKQIISIIDLRKSGVKSDVNSGVYSRIKNI